MEQKLIMANQARQNAYAKYSNFQVGAAIVLKNGQYILGSNVENVSYGLTNCAERTALFQAYTQGYRQNDILELVIMSSTRETISPCGACRQVIVELMNSDAIITMSNVDGTKIKQMKVADLLPCSFSESDLYQNE